MEALSIRAGAFMRAGHSLLIFIIAGGLLCGCSRSQLRRAQSYELSGNTAAALEIYQRLAGSTPPADVRRVSELQMRIGECLFRLGRIPEAFSAFQKAAKADAGNLFAH